MPFCALPGVEYLLLCTELSVQSSATQDILGREVCIALCVQFWLGVNRSSNRSVDDVSWHQGIHIVIIEERELCSLSYYNQEFLTRHCQGLWPALFHGSCCCRDSYFTPKHCELASKWSHRYFRGECRALQCVKCLSAGSGLQCHLLHVGRRQVDLPLVHNYCGYNAA